jgi:long-chain fatty acid transport protein
MYMLRSSLFAVVGLGASAGFAAGNAFNINEHDAAVTGRGGASAASNTSPSSIVFNPGGIAVDEGTQAALGASLYIAEGSYEGSGVPRTETDSNPSLVPSVYVTSRVHEMVAVGVGLHLPFGLTTSWPERHAQQEIIQDQELRTYFITPSVGINLDRQVPGLSFGGGVDLVAASIELEQAILFGDAEGTAHLGGNAFGIGGRLGVMYHPAALEQLKVGAMWRSPVKLNFEGEGDFDIGDPFRSQLPPDGDIASSITLPMSVSGGVAYAPIENLEVEVNAVWIDWSSFDTLTIELPGGAETSSPQNYGDTVTYRLGVEYGIPEVEAAVRAGFIYDPTPIPRTTLTARLPDINRRNLTIGGSKHFGDYGVHLGILWVTPGERETSDEPLMPIFKGTYGVNALVTSLMVSGRFGG